MQQHLHQPTCGIFVQRGVWGFGRGRHYFIGYDVKREGKKKKVSDTATLACRTAMWKATEAIIR